MLVENQMPSSKNHKDVVINEIAKADKMLLVVAYVRENGVDVILKHIKDKPIKLICSLDMGITQLSGIEKLLTNGVEVKVYTSHKGTFHSKIWLFGKDKEWRMLIGSANLTRAALIDNVEASVLVADKNITDSAVSFFNYLWNKENSNTIDKNEIAILKTTLYEREAFKNKSVKIIQAKNLYDISNMNFILEYVKNWIDIPISKKSSVSRLWRGWYVIPDHGLINDQKMEHLISYLPFMKNSLMISKNSNDPNYPLLLVKFKQNSAFKRRKLKTPMHDLFVRQAKNYLIKFGWCQHPVNALGKPDKNVLILTELGAEIAQCNDLKDVKFLYTNYFSTYLYNGLPIVKFTKHLLQRLDYLDIDEFNYFVVHAYNNDDLELIVNLIKMYRSLSSTDAFYDEFNRYFKREKELTASNVYSNYVKSIKHTVSAIGWCEGFHLEDNFKLRLEE